jgi:predicted nucleic acid-binding protein
VTPAFLDTSAVLALINPKDEHHASARRAFDKLRERQASLLTTSYVLVETYALLMRRMGPDAARAFRNELTPLCQVVWIDETLHDAGLDLLLERSVRRLSLVDAVSFVVMRQHGLDVAFAFDPHFEQEGFSLIS